MTRLRLVVLTVVVALAATVLVGTPTAQAAPPAATTRPGAATTGAPGVPGLDRFVRVWSGHTRSLTIRSDATAKAVVYSGCCDHVIDVHFDVVRARGTQRRGRLRAVVTRVRVFDDVVGDSRPHRGDRVTFRVRRGVLVDSATGSSYCNDRAARRSACGA